MKDYLKVHLLRKGCYIVYSTTTSTKIFNDEYVDFGTRKKLRTAPERQHQDFLGWAAFGNKNKLYKSFLYVLNANPNREKYLHLNAIYAPKKYIIRFVDSMNNISYEQEFKHGETIYLKRNDFKNKDKIFGGWATIKDGPIKYSDGDSVKLSENSTLYAIWYTHKIMLINESEIKENLTNNDFFILPKSPFAKRGHEFLGWSLSANKNNVEIKDAESLEISKYKEHLIELHAVWKKHKILVSFDSNRGSGVMPNFSFTYGDQKKLPKNKYKKHGYIFAGWAKSKTGSVILNDEQDVFEIVSEKLTLYAVWRKPHNFEYDEYDYNTRNGIEISLNAKPSNIIFTQDKVSLSLAIFEVFEEKINLYPYIYTRKKPREIYTYNPKHSTSSNFSIKFSKSMSPNELKNLNIQILKDEMIFKDGHYHNCMGVLIINDIDTKNEYLKIEFEFSINSSNHISNDIHSNEYAIKKTLSLGVYLANYTSVKNKRKITQIKKFARDNKDIFDFNNYDSYIDSIGTNENLNYLYEFEDMKKSISCAKILDKSIELFVDIVATDSILTDKEKLFMDHFIEYFNFNRTVFQRLVNKYISNKDDFVLSLEFFGILPKMTSMEKKKKLTEAYFEWNKKVISNDEKVRNNALRVIEFIAKERAKI